MDINNFLLAETMATNNKQVGAWLACVMNSPEEQAINREMRT